MAWPTKVGDYWWLVEKVKDSASGKWKNRTWSTGLKDKIAASVYCSNYNDDKRRMKLGLSPLHKEVAQRARWWEILKAKMKEHIDSALGAYAQKKANFLLGVFEDLFAPASMTLDQFKAASIGAQYVKKRLAGEPATRWCGTEKLVNRPVMASTLRTEISYLSPLFQKAVDEWQDETGLTKNPFKGVKVGVGPGVKTEKDDPKYLSREQVGQFFAECRQRYGQNFEMMAEMFYYAGPRLAECRPILKSDVDLRAGGVMINGTKTGKAKRFVHLPDHFLAKLKLAMATAAPGLLFIHGEAGGMVPYSTIQQRFKRCFRAIGVPWAHAHTLRHCYTSHRLENGDDAVAVRDSVGHESLATTSIYAHRDPKGRKVNLPAPPTPAEASQPAA